MRRLMIPIGLVFSNFKFRNLSLGQLVFRSNKFLKNLQFDFNLLKEAKYITNDQHELN